ncbi:MAG: hypothetical protein ABI460_15250 [Caldimonas sp.]
MLIVLAVVGLLAKTQLRAGNVGLAAGQSDSASQATATTAEASGLTVAGQAASIEQKARDDIARALQQGAARNADADR